MIGYIANVKSFATPIAWIEDFEQVFDYLAIRLDGPAAVELGDVSFDWVVEDVDEHVRITLSNGTLHGTDSVAAGDGPGRTLIGSPFRIGLMGWAMTTGGIGIEWETFTGPFIYFLSFAQYLLPLAILELYLRAKDNGEPAAQIAVASTLVIATLAMSIGIFAATVGMWLPRI